MVDFLVIGPMMSVTYNNVFPLIKDQKIKLGYARVGEFSDGIKFGNTIWFTSFDTEERGYLKLKEYKEGDYKKFDNYDAINIDRVEDIPDFDGLMGVPITFLEKWNPGQFNVLRVSANWLDDKFNGLKSQYIDGKKIYTKILIKKK